jgi:glycosyltransferase involved in cell wall biosynthesis
MRVLRLIARLNVGGPARHVVWLSEGLAQHGHETLLVTGVVPEGEQDMSGFARAHGVAPLVIPSMSRELSPRDLITIWRVWRLMRRFRPDVVHTHTAKAGAVGRIAGLFYRRAAFVHTFHGHVFHSYYGKWKTRLFLFIERMLARLRTDRIVVLGEQQLHEIRDRFRIGCPEQFAIVPLGIDFDALRGGQSLRRDLGLGEHEVVVGLAGRAAPIKNHELFQRVAARCPAARFIIFGGGYEASDIYATIDVLALTSRNEGTPLAIIEALAMEKPVISTAVGGVVDLLGSVEERGDGYDIRERGVTAASDDEAGLAAGLMRLLQDRELQLRLTQRGRAYVEKTHAKERLIADILGLYHSVTR